MRGFLAIVLAAGLAAGLAALGAPASADTVDWSGAYKCGQGVTGVTLRIADGPDEDVDALFVFYQTPANPGVPTGAFRMRGAYSADGSRLELVGMAWEEQPEGYELLNLEAAISDNGEIMIGSIEFPPDPGMCTSFAVVRE